ncbi:MAG: protein kinase [Bacteroidota bacterium]
MKNLIKKNLNCSKIYLFVCFFLHISTDTSLSKTKKLNENTNILNAKPTELTKLEEIYPEFPFEEKNPDFELHQRFTREVVSKIKDFSSSKKGTLVSKQFGKVHYKIKIEQRSFGIAASLTITYGKSKTIEFTVKIPEEETEKTQINEIQNLTLGNECPDIIDFYGAFKLKDGNWAIVVEKTKRAAPFHIFNARKKDLLKPKKHFLQIARAFAFLHDKGYIYHNLQPQNIVIDKKGNARLTNLADTAKPIKGERLKTSFNLQFGSAEYITGFSVIYCAEKRMDFLEKNKDVKKRMKGLLGEELRFFTNPQKYSLIIQQNQYDPMVRKFLVNEQLMLAKLMEIDLDENQVKAEQKRLQKVALKKVKSGDLKKDHLSIIFWDLHAHDINSLAIVLFEQLLPRKFSSLVNYQKLIQAKQLELIQKNIFPTDLGREMLRSVLDTSKPIEKLLYDMLGVKPPTMQTVVKRLEAIYAS